MFAVGSKADIVATSHKRTSGHPRSATRRTPPTTSAVGCIAFTFNLLGDLDSVIDLDAEIPNGALDLRMAQQELDRSEVSSSPVDQHDLRAPERVRTKFGWVETDAGHPILHKSLGSHMLAVSEDVMAAQLMGIRP